MLRMKEAKEKEVEETKSERAGRKKGQASLLFLLLLLPASSPQGVKKKSKKALSKQKLWWDIILSTFHAKDENKDQKPHSLRLKWALKLKLDPNAIKKMWDGNWWTRAWSSISLAILSLWLNWRQEWSTTIIPELCTFGIYRNNSFPKVGWAS